MKFKQYNFKKVISTNQTAIRIIKKDKKKLDLFHQKCKLMAKVNMVKNGFLIKETYLSLFFIV